MTQEQIDEIKARAEAATPGPWEVEKDSDVKDIDFGPILDWPWRIWGPDQAPLLDFSGGCDVRSEDAEFIAHARTDIPALIEEVELWRDRARLYHNHLVMLQRDTELTQ